MLHFVYGHGKGGRESVSYQNYPQVIKYTPRMTAMTNIVLLRLFNRDLFGNFSESYRIITRTAGPVVLHFHVLHSYWLNLKSMMRLCEEMKDHKSDTTLVWALYDYQSVTGRYAFTDGYEGWKTDYQRCPTLNNCPSVKINRVHQLVANKRQLFREMLALGCQLISPSQHVADTFNNPYGPGRCRIVNNGIDMATKVILTDLPPMRGTQGKSKIVVMAHDLRYDGKANQQLICEMMALGGKIELHTFDEFSPLAAGNIVNHGLETDKRKLMGTLNQMGALVSSSRVDNYPLISCETLSIGVPVTATHSGAAREVLQKSGDETVSEEEILQLVQLSKPEAAQAIFGTTLAEFSQYSCAAYSRQQMLEEYINFYQNLQLPAIAADLSAGQRQNRPVRQKFPYHHHHFFICPAIVIFRMHQC